MTSTKTSGRDIVTALDPVFAQMVVATSDHSWALPQLTDREKAFLKVVADVCNATLGLPFEIHVNAGLALGVSTADLRELLRFVSYDTGYPAAVAAFDRLAEIETAAGLTSPDVEPLADELVSTGPDAAPSPLPAPVRERLRELDDHFAEYFDLQSRMRSGYGPDTLTARERAFATMSVDVHYQTLGDTFRIHVDRALRSDASHDDVRAVLRFTAQFGATRVWQAWQALNAHLATVVTTT